MPSPAQRVPAAGSRSSARIRSSVVLPPPFGPTTPTRSPRADDEVDVEQDRIVAVARVDALEREHALAAAGAAAQRERHPAALEHRALDLLHAVDLHLLDARLARGALVDADVRPVAEAAHGLLEARDLLLLGHVDLALALELELARDDVGAVGAGPDPDRAAVELGDLRDRRVEQVAVVGDHHDGAVEVVEQRAEPLAARHVEVGLGLVEQQHVRAPGEAGGERDELALAAGELARGHRARRRRSRARAGGRAPRPRRGRRRPRSSARAPARGAPARGSSRRGRRRGAGRRGAPRRRAGRPRAPPAPAGRRARWRSASRSSPSTICGRWASTSPRRRVTVPAFGVSSPARIRISVDLPPPLGPSTPIRAPASTSRSAPRRIARPPKDLVRPRAAS